MLAWMLAWEAWCSAVEGWFSAVATAGKRGHQRNENMHKKGNKEKLVPLLGKAGVA
jgi:hypothetical protein